MGVRTYVDQWGTSLAVRIPNPIAEQWGIRVGSPIEITQDGDQLTLSKEGYDLDDILSRITVDNLHHELTTGPAQGNEVW